jgi:hypothetical protein
MYSEVTGYHLVYIVVPLEGHELARTMLRADPVLNVQEKAVSNKSRLNETREIV